MFKDLCINSFPIWLYDYAEIQNTLRINTSFSSYVVMAIGRYMRASVRKVLNMGMRKKLTENNFYEKFS